MIPLDKETIHQVIEILTVVFMPMLTYYIRNQSRDVSDKVKDSLTTTINNVISENRRALSGIYTQLNAMSVKDAVSETKHVDINRRLDTLERIYQAIHHRADSQQRLFRQIAEKLKVDDQ